MQSNQSIREQLRLAVETLVTGHGAIGDRLVAAEVHIGAVIERESEMPTRSLRQMCLRMGAELVEGGDGGEEESVAEAIGAPDAARAAEIAPRSPHRC